MCPRAARRDCHRAETDDKERHVDNLAEELPYESCSPTCANRLCHRIQPGTGALRAALRDRAIDRPPKYAFVEMGVSCLK